MHILCTNIIVTGHVCHDILRIYTKVRELKQNNLLILECLDN